MLALLLHYNINTNQAQETGKPVSW